MLVVISSITTAGPSLVYTGWVILVQPNWSILKGPIANGWAHSVGTHASVTAVWTHCLERMPFAMSARVHVERRCLIVPA